MFGRAEIQRTVVLVAALLLTAGSTAASSREFRAADTQNEDNPTVQALRFMGRQIHERSGGRHEMKVFHSRQLGEEKETLEQTRAGEHYRYAGHYTLTEHTVSPEVLVMREKWRDLEQPSRKQTEAAVSDIEKTPFEAATGGMYAMEQRDPASAQLIERIRKVE